MTPTRTPVTIFMKVIDLFLFIPLKEVTGNPRISDEEAAKLIAMRIESAKTKNYGYYRVSALRNFGGGRKVVPHVEPKLQSVSTEPYLQLAPLDSSKSAQQMFRAMVRVIMSSIVSLQLHWVVLNPHVRCVQNLNGFL